MGSGGAVGGECRGVAITRPYGFREGDASKKLSGNSKHREDLQVGIRYRDPIEGLSGERCSSRTGRNHP
jgi:hypothetical protein